MPDTVKNTPKPDQVVTINSPRPTWRSRMTNWAFGIKPADNILKRRAADLVEKLDITTYLQPDGLYVDIGSGTGHNSAHMGRVARGLNARFVCVEPVSRPTPRVLRSIDRKTDNRFHFIRAVGNRLPLPDRHAQGASVFFVLHHIPYDIQLQVLAEIKRVLKPDGHLFVWEDTPENEKEYAANEVWDRRLNFEPATEPHYYRSGNDWESLFTQQGFSITKRTYYENRSRRKNEGRIRHTGFVLRYDKA